MLLSLAIVGMTGCSKDEDVSGPKDNCNQGFTLQELQESNYFTVCSRMLREEINGSDTTLVVSDLRSNDVVENVYYLGADGEAEAEQLFRMRCVADSSLLEYRDSEVVVNMGDYGKITYTKGGQDARAFATITMQLKRMPHAATIYIVPRSSLRDANGMSPFLMGDVVRVTKDNDPKYYICVQEWGGVKSQPGRLIRWGNKNYKEKSDHFKTWTYVENSADYTAIEGLQYLMYGNDEELNLHREALLNGFERFHSNWGEATYNVLTHMTKKLPWDNHSYFISQKWDDSFCWRCWRYPKRLTIEYFYIVDGTVKTDTYYTAHEWTNKTYISTDIFKKNEQTEMLKFTTKETWMTKV